MNKQTRKKTRMN